MPHSNTSGLTSESDEVGSLSEEKDKILKKDFWFTSRWSGT